MLQNDNLKKSRREVEEWLVLQSDEFYSQLIKDRGNICDEGIYSDYCTLIEHYIVRILCPLKDKPSALEFLNSNEILTLDLKEVIVLLNL